ncbi:MAG: tRNA (adenosine(37)-N6)-threonylcarbamoyltransferase complex dimerization subunit type 1 TsaB [Alphaproteobacteria bacterium]|nr:tRNA (adenosine(37)-N6)-threonylcarbamoyltransferase complex dimerization subunit type 1 TsaB [Alphaproteobacteria bacterium]
MKLLALDTAMASCSVAVADTDRGLLLAADCVAMERGHAEALAPMVKTVIDQAGLAFADLDRIAVTTGPGTFTGIRIGLAMARGLGLALARPVVGLDTLTAIACNHFPAGAPLYVATDARRGEAYAALFDADGHRVHGPALVRIDETGATLPVGTIIVGSAAEQVRATSGRNDLSILSHGRLPVAANFVARAATLPELHTFPLPIYIRAPDAKPQIAAAAGVSSVACEAARQFHAGVLAAVHSECFNDPWSEEDFARLLATPGTAAVVAREGVEPLAFVMTRSAADEAEIITIATRPAARRRGVARTLLDHHCEALRRQGIARVFLEVARTNDPALALYAAGGFSEAGLRPRYYATHAGPPVDAIIMRRDLAP